MEMVVWRLAVLIYVVDIAPDSWRIPAAAAADDDDGRGACLG